MRLGILFAVTFLAGLTVGVYSEKRNSDRKMAAIVAERLLRKPEVPSDIQSNLGQMQQLAAMANNNPQVGVSQQSMFSGLLGAAGISQGFSGGSQLQQAITYARDKVE